VGLQAATTSGRPVVLRVEAHGGHGLGSARDQESALCGSSDIGGR
jgi:prolyl oligopeptidase